MQRSASIYLKAFLLLLPVPLALAACAASPVREPENSSNEVISESETAGPATPADKNRLELAYNPKHLVFILIGQSNMEGKPSPDRAEDVAIDPHVHVLAYTDSPGQRRLYNKWYSARPPLHSPYLGVGIGDYFSRTLIKMLPEDYSIGLVPCAIAGVDIDYFRKGIVSKRRNEFAIPPDNTAAGAYDWVLERAKLAAETGTIAGILFHQGESDAGQSVWLDKVSEIVKDLRTDLNLPDLPFLAGELYYRGPCSGHNILIRQIPDRIKNARVVSAKGLNGMDQFHFDLEGQRELGKRYAEIMYNLLKAGPVND
ncbi:MAG: hypothetical protein JW874_13485 [Spirochaetales bacterium]|nr:hypothetical protein [Spirochaetales bacterium]